LRKRLVVIAVTLGLLGAGIIGGTVLATGGDGNGSGPGGLISRVASILGLEEQQIQDAFDEARREIQDERLEEKLAKTVEDGHLTQEQADELRNWYETRPDNLLRGFGFGGLSPRIGGNFGFRGHRSFRGGGGNHRFFFRYCQNGDCIEKQSPPALSTDDTSL
jgi:hypothetical protein